MSNNTIDTFIEPMPTSHSWEEPDLHFLTDGRRSAPAFPLTLLPDQWAAWAVVAAQSACAPVDYILGWLIPLVGSMLSNVRRPSLTETWSEPPLIWSAMIGDPSSGRSPAYDAIAPMIRNVEANMSVDHDLNVRSFQANKIAATLHREKWETEVKTAASTGGLTPLKPKMADDPMAPVRPRLVISDITVEAVAHLASGLPRGLLIVRDEIAGWVGSIGQYKNGAGSGDRAFFLESYGGRRYTVDRKTAGSFAIPHLSVGVTGGIQPDRLPTIISGGDDGFAVRFLWFWPSEGMKFDLYDSRPAPWTFTALERLAGLQMIVNDDDGEPEPKKVKFSAEALDEFKVFATIMQEKERDAVGLLKGALGKAKGHVIRLATILEYLSWSIADYAEEPTEISLASMAAAIGLMEQYFHPMAERVFSDASIPATDRHAIALVSYLRRTNTTNFNKRLLRRSIGGDLREAAVMDSAILTLEQACLLRPEFRREGKTPGRQAQNYIVNPAVSARRA